MKKFFKPTITKLIIFLSFIVLTAFLPHTARICSNAPTGIDCGKISSIGIGYPVFFGEQFRGDAGFLSLNPLYLVINIVIFYTLAALFVFVIRKIRSGSSKPVQDASK